MNDEVKQILKEIEEKQAQINDPNNVICTHCLGLDIMDRYRKLAKLGFIPDYWKDEPVIKVKT